MADKFVGIKPYVKLRDEDHIDMNNRHFHQNVVNNYIAYLDEEIDGALSGDDSELCALLHMRALTCLSLAKFN